MHWPYRNPQGAASPWITWDVSRSSPKEMQQILEMFDLAVLPTGADDLPNTVVEQLLLLIRSQSLREVLSKKARHLALKRFGPQLTERQLPLLIEAAEQIYHGGPQANHYRKKLLEEWVADYSLFDWKMPSEVERALEERFTWLKSQS